MDGETLAALQSAYDPACTDVEVIIDSKGGSPIEAIKIGDWLKSLGKPVKMLAIKAYSAASILWMYGSDDRDKHANAVKDWLMWHRPTITIDSTNADDMTHLLAVLRMVESKMTDVYVSESSLSEDEVKELMAAETYFDDTLAKRYQVLALAGAETQLEDQLTPDNMKAIDDLAKAMKDLSDKLTGKIAAEASTEVEISTEPADDTETIDTLREKLTEMEAKYAAAMTKCEALEAAAGKVEEAMPQMLAKIEAMSKTITAMQTEVTPDPAKAVIAAKAAADQPAWRNQLNLAKQFNA